MNIRTSKPESGNKFYNNGSKGGYSWCINGNPTDTGCNVLANCVGYACGRFNEIIGEFKYKTLCCNAENFIEKAKAAGLEISNVPTLGGIMVWQKGTLSSDDGVGHVAIVERIDSANQIYTSESAYRGSKFYNSTRTNSNGRWGMSSTYSFRGCIINPAIGNVNADTLYPPVVVTEEVPYAQYTDEQLAAMVWSGALGDGKDRKVALGSRYEAVQALVNQGVGKNAPTAAESTDRYYTVQRGDTLSGIAKKYGTTWNKIYNDNKDVIGANPDLIYAGQKLVIK